MPDNTNPPQTTGAMRVFISWSGERSKVLAQALKDWLPLVLHYVEPWMSEANIDAGDRWAAEVGKELEASNVGIICITRENASSPWVLFEAGALAKSLQDSRVIPLLLDLDFKDITGPLAQFQAKKTEKAGIYEVVQAINQNATQPVPENRAKDLFEALWPKLEKQVAEIPKPANSPKPTRSSNDVMEELVAGVRALEVRIREMDDSPRSSRNRKMRFNPMMFEEMVHVGGDYDDPVSLLMAASMVRDDAPWLYELALEVYRTVKSGSVGDIERELLRLRRLEDKGIRGSWLDEFGGNKDAYIWSREFPRMLVHMLERTLEAPKRRPPPPPPRKKNAEE